MKCANISNSIFSASLFRYWFEELINKIFVHVWMSLGFLIKLFLYYISDSILKSFFLFIAGFIFLDKSRAKQQTAFRVLFEDHTIGPLPGQSNGGHRKTIRMELRLDYLWRIQLRSEGMKRILAIDCFQLTCENVLKQIPW